MVFGKGDDAGSRIACQLSSESVDTKQKFDRQTITQSFQPILLLTGR
jgi:hypothetical protein